MWKTEKGGGVMAVIEPGTHYAPPYNSRQRVRSAIYDMMANDHKPLFWVAHFVGLSWQRTIELYRQEFNKRHPELACSKQELEEAIRCGL